jgi:hypothetical protein
MRHLIWTMAAGLFMLTACTLTTPTPNQGSTPSPIATVAPDQPTPINSDMGEARATATSEVLPTLHPPISGTAQVTKEANAKQTLVGPQTPDFPYRLQSGTPAVLTNFLNSDGCNYMGVGGQVFKLNGDAVTGLVVEITGTLGGKNVLFLVLTGSVQNLGPGGYEVKLGTQPVASNGTLKIQVFDLNGIPQTPLTPISTYADCTKNFILVNFFERFPIKTQILLPVMRR